MLKQLFFKYITNPIAKFLDFFNIKKRCLLEQKRNLIALHNRNDYIETTSKVLLETRIIKDISEGRRVDPIEVPEIIAECVQKAIQMFNEKKRIGDFDELNIMLK